MTELELDEKIAVKKELIAKDEAEINRRKKRIEKLKAEIKVLDTEKKTIFSKDLLNFFVVRGINSAEQRKALFDRLEEVFPIYNDEANTKIAETIVNTAEVEETEVDETEITEETATDVDDDEMEIASTTDNYYVGQISETAETYADDETSENQNYYRQAYPYNTGNFKNS